MLKRRRRSRLSSLSFNKMIPNILTLLALSAGVTSIRFAVDERWGMAVFAIVLAGVLDGLDGRIARLLGGTSKFGAELDSLSDFIAFGIAPALLLYFWTMNAAGGFGWALALLFCVCSALRLARFNTMIGQPDLPPWAFNFFTGVPAPAAAGLVMLPLILWLKFEADFLASPVLSGVFMIGVAFLMVSRLPTFSFKGIRVPNHFVLPLLLVVGVAAAFLVSEPWLTLGALGIAYLLSIPLSVRSFAILQKKAESLQTATDVRTEENGQAGSSDSESSDSESSGPGTPSDGTER